MTKLTLEVPEEVIEAVRLPPAEMEGEFRKELAVALYQRGVLPLGKARILAEMTRWQFEKLLADRQIPRDYSAADLAEDLQHAHGRL
jgi:predicted HTH domain antitoxin